VQRNKTKGIGSSAMASTPGGIRAEMPLFSSGFRKAKLRGFSKQPCGAAATAACIPADTLAVVEVGFNLCLVRLTCR
jgi:hypothetical protein